MPLLSKQYPFCVLFTVTFLCLLGCYCSPPSAIAEILNGEDGSALDDYIEECLHRREPLQKVLRLLCLKSLAAGGLSPKAFDFFRREILQAGASLSSFSVGCVSCSSSRFLLPLLRSIDYLLPASNYCLTRSVVRLRDDVYFVLTGKSWPAAEKGLSFLFCGSASKRERVSFQNQKKKTIEML